MRGLVSVGAVSRAARGRVGIAAAALLVAGGLAVPPSMSMAYAAAARARAQATAPTAGQDSVTSPDGEILSFSGPDTLIDAGPAWHVALRLNITTVGGMAATPDGQFVYITDEVNNSITVIGAANSADAKVIGTLCCVGTPAGVAVSPDGKFAYIAGNDENEVAVISDADTDHPDLTATSLPVPFEGTALNIAVTPDGKYAYVSDPNLATVDVFTKIETAHPVLVKSIRVSNGPFGLEVTPDGKYVYLSYSDDLTRLLIIGHADSSDPSIAGTFTDKSGVSLPAMTPNGKFGYFIRSSTSLGVMENIESAHPTFGKPVALPAANWNGILLSSDGQYGYLSANGEGIAVLNGAETVPRITRMRIGAGQNIGVADVTATPYVGIYADLTGDRPAEMLRSGWPLLADVAGLGSTLKAKKRPSIPICSGDFTRSTGQDGQVEDAISEYQQNHRATVPWVSIWTIAAPPPDVAPGTAGLAAGVAVGRKVEDVYKEAGAGAVQPAFVVFDPEGPPCGDKPDSKVKRVWVEPDKATLRTLKYIPDPMTADNWREFADGWARGIRSIDSNVTLAPGIYVASSWYKTKKVASIDLPVFMAATRCALVVDGKCKKFVIPANAPVKPQGTMIVSYVAFFATCTPHGVDQAELRTVRSWGGIFNTVQFQPTLEVCPH